MCAGTIITIYRVPPLTLSLLSLFVINHVIFHSAHSHSSISSTSHSSLTPVTSYSLHPHSTLLTPTPLLLTQVRPLISPLTLLPLSLLILNHVICHSYRDHSSLSINSDPSLTPITSHSHPS